MPNLADQIAQPVGTPQGPLAGFNPGAILYKIPSTGAVIDLNTVPQSVITQLIAQDPSAPQLIGKMQDFQKQTAASAPPPPPTPVQTYNQGIDETTRGLTSQIAGNYDTALKSGLKSINSQFDTQRGKQVAEEAALGRLTSPVSIGNIAAVDNARGNAVSSFTGGLAGQQAGDLTGLAKTIAGLKTDALGQGLQNTQFNQNLGFQQGKLQSDINQQSEDRGLAKYLQDKNRVAQKDLAEQDLNNPLNVATKISGIAKNIGDTASGGMDAYGMGKFLKKF